MHRVAIVAAIALLVFSLFVFLNGLVNATEGELQNVTLAGMVEGIDVRWETSVDSNWITSYQVAYQATERSGIAGSWAFMWTSQHVHLIRHLAGGYEYRVYVRGCSETRCSEWADGETVWTKKPSALTYTVAPIPTPTPRPTATPTAVPRITYYAPELVRYQARHSYPQYLRTIQYWLQPEWTGRPRYRIDGVWHDALLEVQWREASSSGAGGVTERKDASSFSIKGLNPATDYHVVAQHWSEHHGYGSISKTYTVRTTDVPTPQPCTPKTGTLSSSLYPYADLHHGIAVQIPIVFVNPDQQKWAYHFKSKWRAGSSHVLVSIDQNGQWTFTIQFGWNAPIITTGQVENFDGNAGARNRFAFSIPSSGLASGGGWYYGQFKMYVNDEQIPIEVPERILENLRRKNRDVYVRSSATVEYEYYTVTYARCRQWWHYW